MLLEGAVGPLGRDNTSAFLTAMLERKESVVGQQGGVGMPKNGEYAALMSGFVFQRQGLKRRQLASFL